MSVYRHDKDETWKALFVVPSIDPRCGQKTLESIKAGPVMFVDNAPPNGNLGVAASWNMGIDELEKMSYEWLIVCSEAVVFGAAGGRDFVEQLGDEPWYDSTFGWHLVAFRRDTIERVGRFDENFYPAYLEDTDYLTRLHLAGLPSPRENHLPHTWISDVDASDHGTEHSLRKQLVTVDLGTLGAYYARKWGMPQPGHAWAHPFNDETKDWRWWPGCDSD